MFLCCDSYDKELTFTQLSLLNCFVNTILFSAQSSNHKKFSLSSKSGTLLPEFPKANTVQLPEGVSIYKVRSLYVILYEKDVKTVFRFRWITKQELIGLCRIKHQCR